MSEEQVKAEADKIEREYYPFVEGIDIGERKRATTQCAIIHVKGILEEIDMYKGELNPRWKQLQSILTELENR